MMKQKFPILVHSLLLVFSIIFLGILFFEKTNIGGVIDDRRASLSCQEIDYTETMEKDDPDAPIGITRLFRFTLHNELAGKQLMFYVINANTKIYIQGECVYDLHRDTSNPVGATGCYWVNLPLIRADNGKEVVVKIQPLYQATANRTMTFYDGSRYPLFWQLFRHDALFLLISILLVVFGILYLSVAFYYRIRLQMVLYLSPLGMVSILIGLWKIADTQLITWLIPGHDPFFSYLSMLSIMLTPFFIALFIYTSSQKNSAMRKATRILTVLNGFLVLCAFALHLLKIYALRDSQAIYNYIMLIQAVFLMAFELILYQKHKNNLRHKMFLLSMVLLMCAGALDIIWFWITHSSNSLFFTVLGVMIYIIAVGIFTLRGTQDKLFRDKATGLYNRNKCNELIHAGIVPDDRLCFLMFDLNGLKKTNDSLGHDAGDQMIAEFAAVLRKCIPAGNFIGRSGGDEFISIIYNTDESRVEHIVANIREQLTAANSANANLEKSWKLDAALGYAFAFEAKDRSYATLYDLADKRMYENKRAMKASHK